MSCAQSDAENQEQDEVWEREQNERMRQEIARPEPVCDDTWKYITEECDDIRELLLEKNRKYGNSALEPERIFSQASSVEQLLVRIDDKLSRIKSMGYTAAPDEDTVRDLIGYLILLRVAQRKETT